MRTGRIFILSATIIALCAVQTVTAQSTWAGSAVVGRYGEFPPGGLYAASNTFPLNSMVDVTNDATGDTVRVIVVRRIDDPGVFMLLSEEAADQLRIRRGAGGTVSTQPVQLPGLTAIGPNQDLPFHPDPDINPGAIFGDPNREILFAPETALALTTPPPVTPAPPVAPAPLAAAPDFDLDADEAIDPRAEFTPAEAPQDLLVLGPDPGLPRVVEPAILEQPLPRVAPPVQPSLMVTLKLPTDPNGLEPRLVRPDDPAVITDPLQARLDEIDRTLAGERVSMAPLDRTPANGLTPAAPPVSAVDSDPELPLASIDRATTAPDVVALPPGPPPAAALLIELPLVALLDEADAIDTEPVRPSRIPDDAVLALEPAEFRAPQVPDPAPEPELEPELEPAPPAPAVVTAPPPVPTPAPVAAPLPIVSALDRGAYYVQVAALTSEESVARTVRQLNGAGEGFPVAVTAQQNGERQVYRIYVGPLSEDERGTVLYTVRTQGFRDAFLRRE